MNLHLSRLRRPVDAPASALDPSDADQLTDRSSGRRERAWTIAMVLAVDLPVAVAAIRAVARGWRPLGDNGILLVRAADVGTTHHPLLGSWTSASMVLDQHMNNPGPLYFDAVAPTTRLLGPWVGLPLGVMLVNMAAAALAVVAARRIAGVASMVAVAATVAVLEWVLGSELLFDVWQPNALVMPMLAYLVVAVVLATADLGLAPWFVGLASLLVQTHLNLAPVVVAVSGAVVVVALVEVRRRGTVPRWRRPLVLSLTVAALAWVQPLIEQFSGPGEGNLSRLAGSAFADRDSMTLGWDRAVRLLAEVVAAAPWFARGSYAGAVPQGGGDRSLPGVMGVGPAVLVIVLMVAAMVGVAVAGRRWASPGLTAMGSVAALSLVGGVVALTVTPLNAIGVSPHQLRWLWPLGALVSATLLTAILAGASRWPAWGPRAVTAVGGLALVAAVATLPTYVATSGGPDSDIAARPAAEELVDGMGALRGRGTVLFEPLALRFGEPYSGRVFAELRHLDIPFVFDDEGFIRQFGEGRRHEGDADLRMWVVEGDAALTVPPGVERVGFAEGREYPVALFVEPIAD